LAVEYQRSAAPSSFRATGFVLHNSLNLFSNFTYFLDDPVNGDHVAIRWAGVREEGAAAFEARMGEAMPLSDYLLTELSSRADTSSVDGRAKLVELARPLLHRIPSDVYRELLVNQLAEAVRMAPARLAELLGGAEPGEHARPAQRTPFTARPGSPPSVSARGNLVRQAVGLLVHFPAAAGAVAPSDVDALAGIDRAGVPLLIELLTQLREDPPANTAMLLERWRDRTDHGPLSKLAAAELLVPDRPAAEAELRSAVRRLVAEEAPAHRLDQLLAKARDVPLDEAEKAELQTLLKSKGQSANAGRDQ
jgi:DNA primase